MKIDFAATDTLAQARQKLTAAFTAAGKEAAGLESRLFLQAATGLTPLALATCADGSLLDQASAALLRDYAARRFAGEPVSRILGQSGFYGLNLHVAPDVLDPRADTETLVNAALGLLNATKATRPRILDLGVGSGPQHRANCRRGQRAHPPVLTVRVRKYPGGLHGARAGRPRRQGGHLVHLTPEREPV